MSRKFNSKKFIKDVLNDRYALVIGNHGDLTKVFASSNVYSCASEAGFMVSRTYVHGQIDMVSIYGGVKSVFQYQPVFSRITNGN